MNYSSAQNRHRFRSVELPNKGLAEVWFELRGDSVEMHVTHKSSENSGSGTSNWRGCSSINCTGEAIPESGACYTHSSSAHRQSYLNRIHANKDRLSLCGTTISQEVWNEITASRLFSEGRPVIAVNLAGAEINARIEFQNCRLEKYFHMSCASVFKPIVFRRCTFDSSFIARHTIFDAGPPSFTQCVFKEDVDISYVQVNRVSFGLERCVFERSLKADGFSGGGLILSGSEVAGSISLRNSSAHLIANEISIDGAFDLLHSDCIGINGDGLVLRGANRLGPFKAGSLQLSRARFGSRVLIEVDSKSINFTGAHFVEGGLVLAHRAKLYLEQLRLGGPLRVSGSQDDDIKTQVLTLRNADAGSISFAELDLSRCSFQGAHGLDTVDIQPNVYFATTPWWTGKRRFLADEYAWRIRAGRWHNIGWRLHGVHVGSALPQSDPESNESVLLPPLRADQVAVIYRRLRHSMEGKSDMPGAADFYYGEMEMRRWNTKRPLLERIFVWCYWSISGYGLRAGRAILAWLLLVAAGAWGFIRFGIYPEPSLPEAVLSAIRAAIPGFPTHSSLSQAGLWIETSLRVLGAIIIAMFLLAIRSMVMRKPSE